MKANVAHYSPLPSPLGTVWAAVDARGALVRLEFARDRVRFERQLARAGYVPRPSSARLARVRRALRRFFAGDVAALRLPVAARGTPFQERVWRELATLRPGRTISYAELARRIGRPTAVRAVGRANATNPVALVVPCHRVLASSGALTGYAGGVGRKRRLLALEQRSGRMSG
jgi:methylated-DNA-[protein]-cysteine S-methyltransferase